MIQIRTTLRNYAKVGIGLYARGMKNAAKQSYTKTVLLPQTNFPARLGDKKRVEMDNYLIEVSLLHFYSPLCSSHDFLFCAVLLPHICLGMVAFQYLILSSDY